MKYISWAAAVTAICITIGLCAFHFHRPAMLLGLIGIFFLPNPYEEWTYEDDIEDDVQ